EREGQVVLLLELDVLRLFVGRDAEHDGACALELGVCVADPTSLSGTAGRVVLGLEVEDDRLASTIGEADALAGVGRRGEVRCRLALGDHLRSVLAVPLPALGRPSAQLGHARCDLAYGEFLGNSPNPQGR